MRISVIGLSLLPGPTDQRPPVQFRVGAPDSARWRDADGRFLVRQRGDGGARRDLPSIHPACPATQGRQYIKCGSAPFTLTASERPCATIGVRPVGPAVSPHRRVSRHHAARGRRGFLPGRAVPEHGVHHPEQVVPGGDQRDLPAFLVALHEALEVGADGR